MLAALVVAGAWSLTLGTVAVVHLGRLVDTLTLATAAPPASTAPAGFEALPVEWDSGSNTALWAVADALCEVARAIGKIGLGVGGGAYLTRSAVCLL